MKSSALLGGLLATSLIVCAILIGTSLATFVDTISMTFITVGTLLFLLQAHGTAGLGTIRKATGHWLKKNPYNPAELPDASCVVRSGTRGMYLVATVAAFIGMIQIMRHLADPAHLGPAMSVMFLCLFYTLCTHLVFWYPLGRWLEQQSRT